MRSAGRWARMMLLPREERKALVAGVRRPRQELRAAWGYAEVQPLSSSSSSSSSSSGFPASSFPASTAANDKDDKGRPAFAHDEEEASTTPVRGEQEQDLEQKQEPEPVRLAKFMSNARVCSRREAERLISEGKVLVNGVAGSVTTFVTNADEVTLDDKVITKAEAARFSGDVFLCYKLRGELITYSDPKGRPTLFQRLEQMGLPSNLISVGRLDYESEGLILLTTNGDFARYMELPQNNIVRKYRARVVSGVFSEKHQDRLLQGVTVRKGVEYRPIVAVARHTERKNKTQIRHEKRKKKRPTEVIEDVRHQWLDVLVTEGKYREIRQALASIGLVVDRLIRIEYGPYALGKLQRGDVLRVRRRDLLAKKDRKKKGHKKTAGHAPRPEQ